jgi:hypothetical protein
MDLLGVMACVAAGFFLVLKIGFVLHHDPQPAPISSNGLTLAAILVLSTGMVIVALRALRRLGRARFAQPSSQVSAAIEAREARRLRVAELAADPARARYAPLVARGETWSDEDILYEQHPELTTTCAHLEPIERAMRRAGVHLRRYRQTSAVATCCIDSEALQRAFTLAPPVRYAEFFAEERAPGENPTAFLICDEHDSMIHTVHPAEATGTSQQLPRFPMNTPL